jgi:hypothetical protein
MKFTLPLAVFALGVAVDAAAIAEPSPQWCLIRGQSCWKVKRAAEAFADAVETSNGLTARDESGSEDAYVAKRQLDALALAIAASQHNPAAYYGGLGFAAPEKTEKREADPQWCLIRGQSCWKAKRDANPQWCLIRGQSCWKAKRAAEAVVAAIEAREPEVKRDASAEASCNAPDGACTLANRNLHAILNVARSIVDAHSE